MNARLPQETASLETQWRRTDPMEGLRYGTRQTAAYGPWTAAPLTTTPRRPAPSPCLPTWAL